jgi:hypothetical protein
LLTDHANCFIFTQLPETPLIQKIRLTKKSNGDEVGIIENKPGSTGSVRVYNYLLGVFGESFCCLNIMSCSTFRHCGQTSQFDFTASGGEITRQAAYLALAVYGEHVEDAHANPGKHGNIDRLFQVVSSGESLIGEIHKLPDVGQDGNPS